MSLARINVFHSLFKDIPNLGIPSQFPRGLDSSQSTNPDFVSSHKIPLWFQVVNHNRVFPKNIYGLGKVQCNHFCAIYHSHSWSRCCQCRLSSPLIIGSHSLFRCRPSLGVPEQLPKGWDSSQSTAPAFLSSSYESPLWSLVFMKKCFFHIFVCGPGKALSNHFY